ncbi:MAG TPA: GTPase HflX [Vicinamibacterales bacterium]|nr:GTPase HflX [Vicinamibacterales bacterium]
MSPRKERAILVGLLRRDGPRVDPERALDELAGLAEAAGAEVIGRVVQERPAPDPATFLGAGKVAALATRCAALGADLVLVDNELTPAQLRNLEQRLGIKVVDRTQLILDIFARRARTREGQLQVELAQLRYLLPRLVGSGQALSRLGGGIGTRGPGETKLETDRRRIRRRLATLARALEEIRRRRSRLRRRRARAEAPVVSLVGYTNAGKTTLFNALTGEAARVSDALFVTLDPLVRRLRLGEGATVLLTDTVGFIDRLPHSLVAAFRATLEEIVDADLLLHVVDAAHPERQRHIRTVEEVLAEIGASSVPRLVVFNKCDLLDDGARARLEAAEPEASVVSALRGQGCEALRDRIAAVLGFEAARVSVLLDDSARARATLAAIYRHGRVLRHSAAGGRVRIEAEVPRRLAERLPGARPTAHA